MSAEQPGQPGYLEGSVLDLVEQPPPGQGPIVLAALAIGITLMAIQLWLLTVALDLYLGGRGGEVWRLAIVSGLIFAGGRLMLWLLRRRPSVRRLSAGPPEMMR